MESLKILQVSSAKEIGGGESHLITLVKGLAKLGHVVSLAIRPSSPLPNRLPDLRDRLFEVRLRNSLDIFSARNLARIIKTENIDIIHCHYARDYLIGALAVKIAGSSKLVLTRHVPFAMKNNIGYRKALSGVSRMICVSDSVRRGMIDSHLLEQRRIVRIYNGIDIDRYKSLKPDEPEKLLELRKRLGLPTRELLIGVVGQLATHKGQKDFVEAAAIVSKNIPTAAFVVVGRDYSKDESYKKELQRRISDSNLSDRITLIDDVEQLPQTMAALDILVLPSLVEAFGLVLVEGMASGTNVISTNIDGPNEILRHQETGLLVPPNRPDQIAQAVIKLFNDLQLRKRLADNARQDVIERFSAEKMVTETEKVYREVVSEN